MAVVVENDVARLREIRSYPLANATEQAIHVFRDAVFIAVVRDGALPVLLAHVDPRERSEPVIVHLRKINERFEHQGLLSYVGAVPQSKLQALVEHGLSDELVERRRAKWPRGVAF